MSGMKQGEICSPIVGHRAAPNKPELPKGVAQLPSHAAPSRLSSRPCLCQCNYSSPGNPLPPFRPKSRRSPWFHPLSQILISCLLNTSCFCLLEHIKCFSQKIKSMYDFGNCWLQELLPLESTGKMTPAVVFYSTAGLYSSSLPESVSQKCWGWGRYFGRTSGLYCSDLLTISVVLHWTLSTVFLSLFWGAQNWT